MLNNVGKSVRLYLMDGVANGRWVGELSNWTGKAYKIPRMMLEHCNNRDDLQSPGVYLLFGKETLSHASCVYIGETENIYTRLKKHHADSQKDYWHEVICFISKDRNLNKAHIKYLEHHLYHLAKETKSFIIKNKGIPTCPQISEADQADMEVFLNNIQMMMPILGHKLFEKINQASEHQTKLFLTSRRGADAAGCVHAEGFMIFKGSCVAQGCTPSFNSHSYAKLRETLLRKNVLVQDKDLLMFSQDYVFNSASAAAAIVHGRSANGLTEWKTKAGDVLKSLGE